MSLSKVGSIRINVTGARGPVANVNGEYLVTKSQFENDISDIERQVGAAQSNIEIVATIADRDAFYATEANREKLVYVNNNNGSATDPANGVYEYVNGAPRLALAFYRGVSSIVQPLVDLTQNAANAAALSSAQAQAAAASAKLTAPYADRHLALDATSSPAYADPIAAATDSTDGYIDALFAGDLSSYTAAASVVMGLTGRWNGSMAEQRSWILCLSPTGALAFLYHRGDNGAYASAVSTVSLPSTGAPRFLRGLINTKAVAVTSAVMVNNAAFVLAPGAAAFFTSPDGVTWTQLGATVTGLGATGLRSRGVSPPNPVVGYDGGSDTHPVGKVYRVEVRDSAKILWNPDFTAQPAGTRTFADTAPTQNTWIVGSKSSIRAVSAALRAPSPRKLRCLNLNSDTNFWSDFWGVKWSQAEVTKMLDFAVDARFNAVKIYSDGQRPLQPTGRGLVLTNDYPSDTIMQQRIQWVAEQCRLRGLSIYLAQNQSSEFAQVPGTDGTDPAVWTQAYRIELCRKHLQWWMTYAEDLVALVDLNNEINGSHGGGARWGANYSNNNPNSQAYTDLGALMAMGRETVKCPITLSVFMQSADHYVNNGWFDLQYDLGCDYHDYHPYHDFYTNVLPSIANVQALRSRAKYIGKHMIGECGCAEDGTPNQAGAVGGGYPGYQEAFARGMGGCAQTSDSYGANWWMARPYYDGSSNTYTGSTGMTGPGISVFGLLNASLDLVRPLTVAAIQASWPAKP